MILADSEFEADEILSTPLSFPVCCPGVYLMVASTNYFAAICQGAYPTNSNCELVLVIDILVKLPKPVLVNVKVNSFDLPWNTLPKSSSDTALNTGC